MQLLSGNEACAEGALAAGVRFFAAYPISPSNQIAEVMARRLPELGGKFIQMEDEIGALAAAIGGSLAGLKSMDATSGPGFSLKQENLGLAVMLEVPLVLVDVQRVGPSTGMATLPAQGDVMQARWGTHGDHSIIVLAPSTVRECFDVTVRAVNFSEKYRTPVVVLTDASIAYLREKVEIPQRVETVERQRPTQREGYRPYAAGPDGVPPIVDYGAGYHWYANSSMHDEGSFEATTNHEVANALIRRLHAKIERGAQEIISVEHHLMDDAEVAVFAYGSPARAARGALKLARAQGIRAGLVKTLTLWPFPEETVREVAGRVRAILVPEMNTGQIVSKVREAAGGRARVVSLPRFDGRLITPDQIVAGIQEALRG